jgi:aminomethyltransferase
VSTDAGIIRTAFDDAQRRLGAEFMDWEGWYWPTTFGDPVAEHHAVRRDVGVWDESPLRKWDFSGPDALAAADRIFTNDMLGLELGQVRYAPFCDENGKMVGDGTVFKFTDSSAWVITALDSDLDHFQDVVAGMDVSIEPITEKLPHVQLQGPRSRELLAGLVDEDVESLAYFRFLPHQVHVGRVPAWVSRTGYSGELGYELFVDPDHAEELWATLTEAGATPYGLSAVESLRIESGLIFIGYDYFQHETDPFDMSLLSPSLAVPVHRPRCRPGEAAGCGPLVSLARGRQEPHPDGERRPQGGPGKDRIGRRVAHTLSARHAARQDVPVPGCQRNRCAPGA